jgi:3'5'-cyclic nucleotide phosphodiesterase
MKKGDTTGNLYTATRPSRRIRQEHAATSEADRVSTSSLSQNMKRDSLFYAATALALTVQDWKTLGRDNGSSETDSTSDLEILVDRITSLLVVRIAAVASASQFSINLPRTGFSDTEKPLYTDYSTSTVCRTLLMEQKQWDHFTPTLTQKVIDQLRKYVHRILSGYNDVPYHNREHAFHVVLSSNKLLDMMIQQSQHPESKKANPHPTYGLRRDPIQLMGLMFAALVHDVEHMGIPNRQLAMESDPLAVQYNDFSIAEQRSLYIAFHELLQDDYSDLRSTMFCTSNVGIDAADYRRFRTTVVNLVLNTDIASPERTQLSKSKWKEAFGEKVKRITTSGTESTTETSELTSIPEAERPGEQASRRRRLRRGIRSTEVADQIPAQLQDDSIGSDDDYTIPVTPDDSVFDADDIEYDHEDDGMIYHSLMSTKGDVGSVSTHPVAVSNNVDFQLQNEKLERLIKLARRESLGRSCYGTNQFSTEEIERQRLYGNQIYEPLKRSGPRIQKSSSLPGKLSPTVTVIDCSLIGSLSNRIPRQRQMSAPHSTHVHRKRLGIRRSMDLSGEALETYSRTVFHHFLGDKSNETEFEKMLIHDQPDELKASVVLELILLAADVAHNLQGWEQMVKWSGRLYMELRRAFVSNRSSFDPQARWYENQIGFLESYLLPLAERMIDSGVFVDSGVNFLEIVNANREQWIAEGVYISEQVVEDGENRYPRIKCDTHTEGSSTLESSAVPAMGKIIPSNVTASVYQEGVEVIGSTIAPNSLGKVLSPTFNGRHLLEATRYLTQDLAISHVQNDFLLELILLLVVAIAITVSGIVDVMKN